MLVYILIFLRKIRTEYIRNDVYGTYIEKILIEHTSAGLASARPNYIQTRSDNTSELDASR